MAVTMNVTVANIHQEADSDDFLATLANLRISPSNCRARSFGVARLGDDQFRLGRRQGEMSGAVIGAA